VKPSRQQSHEREGDRLGGDMNVMYVHIKKHSPKQYGYADVMTTDMDIVWRIRIQQ